MDRRTDDEKDRNAAEPALATSDDTERRRWQIEKGTDVVGSDGDKVGSVIGFSDSYIVVEKGWFFPTDYYIPVNAIQSVDRDTVRLTVDKESALNQGWDVIPGDESVGVAGGAFITGATGYDEPVGVNIRGDEFTDADLRLGTEYESSDDEATDGDESDGAGERTSR